MSSYCYVAVDAAGAELRGTLDVPDQFAAVRRIKEMGLFPTRIHREPDPQLRSKVRSSFLSKAQRQPFSGRVPRHVLTAFTRQTATLIEAGMPLLRGLRLLQEQQQNRALNRILQQVAATIEAGGSLTEALSAYPKVFNALYLNMIRAGEAAGALDVTLRRLADFMERAQRIRNKVKAALFYPCAVLCVAAAILAVLMFFVVPRFQQVFNGLLDGRALPAFTALVLGLSQAVQAHAIPATLLAVAGVVGFRFLLATRSGRNGFDRFKLSLPGIGPLLRHLAIARFARTLGTLLSSGVPVLQALNIVKDTAGNVVVARVIGHLHDAVKEGDPLAPTLKGSGVFPPMVAGMVDVGEQTGALPEMLARLADQYEDEVDNAATAMTSLLEPVLIVFLAVIVGGIVIAMFLPLIHVMTHFNTGAQGPDA